MKQITRIILLGALLVSFYTGSAQAPATTTIIVVRHAEKDTAKIDPALSKEGKTRAENLVLALADFTPDAVYSTNYKRTRSTILPLATKFNLEIQSYEARDQKNFAEQLKAMAGKTIVVAGHSNTVPRLVNLLAGVDKYPDLEDSVYNQIYIVRITDGVPSVEIKQY
jgi:2,3-bisphosphoglycerate-dependent phosphoglycerate mutase